MKRSDLPTATVLAAVRDHGYDAFDVLCESMPPKVVLAALERDNGRGLLDYGTCMEHSWLTPEGRDALLDAQPDDHPADPLASGLAASTEKRRRR